MRIMPGRTDPSLVPSSGSVIEWEQPWRVWLFSWHLLWIWKLWPWRLSTHCWLLTAVFSWKAHSQGSHSLLTSPSTLGEQLFCGCCGLLLLKRNFKEGREGNQLQFTAVTVSGKPWFITSHLHCPFETFFILSYHFSRSWWLIWWCYPWVF